MDLSRFVKVFHTANQAIKILWKISSKILIASLFINIIWGFLSVPAFYLEKLIIDRVVENLGATNVQIVLGQIVFLVLGRATIEFARIVLGNTAEYLRYVSARLFSIETEIMLSKKISELDVATLENPNFQDRFNKIQREIGSRAWNFVYPIITVPNYLSGFISSVALLIFLSPLIALGAILISIPQFFFDSRFIKKEYSLDTKLSPLFRTWGWLVGYLLRSRNYLELKLLNLNPFFLERLRKLVDLIYTPRINLERQRTIIYGFVSIPSAIYLFGVNIYLVFLAITKRITVGSLEMYFRALISTQTNVAGLVSNLLQVYESYLYIEDFVWLMDQKPKINPFAKGIEIKGTMKKGLEFRNVWFAYRDKEWILKDISFHFKPGQKIAVIGKNGQGKSTIIKLIARFYDPQKGQILFDGINIRKLDLVKYRERIAILIQRFETYPFSAKESIGYGDLNRYENLDEIIEAAKLTDMHLWISGLPLDYNTPLSPEFEKGVEPSIGQWQRIAISRILFRKNADILILDEPTSNVDPKAEEDIFKKFANLSKNKILIFVSQRFSTVRIADEILVVDKGQIVEKGTHEDLMKLNGEYAELFKLQAKGYQ